MTKEVVEALGARLDTLAAKLGVVGAHLWAVLVRQAYIDGCTDFALSGMCLVSVLACAWTARRAYRIGKKSEEWVDPDFLHFLVGVAVVLFYNVYYHGM